MSSVILPQVGTFIGGSLAGPIGSAIGQGLGSAIGGELDHQLFSNNKKKANLGPRLSEVTLQTAAYGRMIPIVYGTVKIAGNIIWSTEIKQHRHDHYQRRGKFGGKSLVLSEFDYTVSLAIAICEGEVNEILRVWADDRLIDPRNSSYRFYPGSDTQMTDHLIEAHQGIGRTTAFRGLAYIVIENLSLLEFGNRIPNFIFEIKRNVKTYNNTGEIPLEERIKAMVIIPGSGEFVYDTEIQCKAPKNYNSKYGTFNLQKTKINQNNRENIADSLLSLKQLHETCPNLQWVSPVVGWFTNSLTAGNGSILPGVEYKETNTIPDEWIVGKYSRESAYEISKNKYGSPAYGGTSNDISIIRYLDVIKTYGYKIMFYPMLFVDVENKPWRGRITGTVEGIKKFFRNYNKFIIHYAHLVKGKVDAFLIGSEMIGLTKVRDKNNNFPAVDELVELAKKVKDIMGDKVKISYAADWSEYHHTDSGWYNMDKLWACDAIDFIGIDAYFPLTNKSQDFYDEAQIIEGWESGEGYDYYYEDQNKTKKKLLNPEYAWKNIAYWWGNQHINPDGNKTNWVAKQKKIWFTEIGFPSVDLASNQPNVFYSADSVESDFPIHSKGKIDFVAQRQALSATEKYWRDSEFMEQMFIWTWDARPFPFWPDLNQVWRDGNCWSRGHWVNGKLGLTKLEAIIQDLCKRSDINLDMIKAEELCDFVDGFIIYNQDSSKDIINLLKLAYFFNSHEDNGILHFIKRISQTALKLSAEDLVAYNGQEKHSLRVHKISPFEVVKSVTVHYMNYFADYTMAVEFADNYCNSHEQKLNLNLPIIMDPQKAKIIAETTLQDIWQGQYIYSFTLMPNYVDVKPNDILHLSLDNQIITMRVINTSIDIGRVNKITAKSIQENIQYTYSKDDNEFQNILLNKEHFDPGETDLIILKLPILPYEVAPYGVYLGVMANDEHWRGAIVEAPDGSILHLMKRMVAGVVEVIEEDCLEVIIFNGELCSKSKYELERYENIAALGEEIIQFERAELIEDSKYCLTGIKRELFGSKKNNGNKFILIDSNLQKLPISDMQIGKTQKFLVTSIGHNFTRSKEVEFIYH